MFAGKYVDTNHPHCPRDIDEAGVITGIDPVPFIKVGPCRYLLKFYQYRYGGTVCS